MTNPLEHHERLFRTGDTNYDKKVMRCPDCDEPLNDLWVCEFCQVDYEPSQELKNKVIREFLTPARYEDILQRQIPYKQYMKELEGEDDD